MSGFRQVLGSRPDLLRLQSAVRDVRQKDSTDERYYGAVGSGNDLTDVLRSGRIIRNVSLPDGTASPVDVAIPHGVGDNPVSWHVIRATGDTPGVHEHTGSTLSTGAPTPSRKTHLTLRSTGPACNVDIMVK